MILNENNKKYTIHLCDTIKNSQFMIDWIEKYIKLDKKRIIGIDFEFNRINNVRRIALCQINMEIEDIPDAYIFIFYPPDITRMSDIFKRLLIDSTIIKILHGGESLDIPYLFTDILISDSDRIKFSENLFDTRYMCEYYNISNQLVNNRCRIYDLLKQMNVITNKKFDELEENDRKMGNIWEIDLQINKLSKSVIIYSLYDVLYLPALFNTFPQDDVYTKLLPSISNYNNINRYNNNFITMYNLIAKYNTSYYERISYNEIYTIIYAWLDTYNELYILFQINYFKKFYEILIKNAIYTNLSSEYKEDISPQIMKSITINTDLYNFYLLLSRYIDMVM